MPVTISVTYLMATRRSSSVSTGSRAHDSVKGRVRQIEPSDTALLRVRRNTDDLSADRCGDAGLPFRSNGSRRLNREPLLVEARPPRPGSAVDFLPTAFPRRGRAGATARRSLPTRISFPPTRQHRPRTARAGTTDEAGDERAAAARPERCRVRAPGRSWNHATGRKKAAATAIPRWPQTNAGRNHSVHEAPFARQMVPVGSAWSVVTAARAKSLTVVTPAGGSYGGFPID